MALGYFRFDGASDFETPDYEPRARREKFIKLSRRALGNIVPSYTDYKK